MTYFAAPSLRRLSLLSSNRTSEEKKGNIMRENRGEENEDASKKTGTA